MTLIEIMTALAESTSTTTDNRMRDNRMSSSKSRADEFIEVVKEDRYSYTHRDDYLELIKYLDPFDQKVVLLKLERVDWALWAYLKNLV